MALNPDAPHVAVVGSGVGAGAADIEAASAVGEGLGERGAVVICGGLGGVMEAACRGAVGMGGLTVGILPGSDRRAANPFVGVAVPTALGEARNALVVRMADVLIAIGGEFGTLSEIALALKLRKPVVGLGTWELGKGGARVDAIEHARDAGDAVARALGLVGASGPPAR